MEKGAGDDDSARSVGMCDRFLTFLAKNLSMNRQKNITEERKNGTGGNSNHAMEEEDDDDDEFAVRIEKADFEFAAHGEEDQKSVTATILEERNTDVRSTAAAKAGDQKREEAMEAGRQAAAVAEAAAVAAQEKKVRKSVTIKEDREDAATAVKKSLFKKRQASSSGQPGAGAGGEEPKPPRRGLRPRMPAILRVPTNINEQSTNFIEERKKGFVVGKPEK